MKSILFAVKPALLGLLLLTATGCFRVSSETRALRDAALDNGLSGAEEKIELALGRLTFGAANLGLHFVKSDDIPPEARMILGSVKGAEVSVYHFRERSGSLARVLQDADRALEKRDCERVVGVMQERQLVAVYTPTKIRSPRNVEFYVLVLNDHDLVCASANGDIKTILELAMSKAEEHFPPRTVAMAQ